ncbi:MAG: Asp23/Gls24 family envelope stress response protein [Opitutaceae bacterium]
MQNQELYPEGTDDQVSLGDIKVNHTVVASIVRLAALEINGVSGVGGGFVDGIADLFSKKESDRGVRVSENEHGNYLIELRVIMEFGTELAKTAYEVQLAVSKQVTTMTGKPVERVDVVIEGVKMPSAAAKSGSDRSDDWESQDHADSN